jgi:nanoRNase/pAp phosphatase (c-di-AMP/oligoRNAs hydrolase)
MNILLDTIPINAGVGDNKVDFDIVIDHHKEIPNGGFKGHYLNLKAGSCCGTVFPLMKGLSTRWLEHDNEHDKKIATALISGIVTDTEFMLSDDTTEYEFNAYQELFEYRNHNFLKEIVFFKRPKFWIDVKAKASTAAKVDSEGYAIVGMGILPDKDRDLIADMADEMIQWVGVETAIAFAVIGNGKVEGSVRSDNASLSVSEFCKKLGGAHGSGGGKHGKGAYRYGLGNLELDPDETEGTRQKTWELISDKEYHRIQRMIKK